jgi:hypothetical protein
VHGRDRRLACRHPAQAVLAAVAQQRQTAPALTRRPVEQRVVAARQHRRRAGRTRRETARIGVLVEPALDQVAREQPLSGDADGRDLPLADQLVDRAFGHPQQCSDLAGAVEAGRCGVVGAGCGLHRAGF